MYHMQSGLLRLSEASLGCFSNCFVTLFLAASAHNDSPRATCLFLFGDHLEQGCINRHFPFQFAMRHPDSHCSCHQ